MSKMKNEVRDAAKEFQEKEKGGADSSKQYAAAEHQARNDAQKSGEDLPKRDASEKEDVPSKEEKEGK
jgi:hypothetical protein